jgi:hypothetical protein
VARRGEKFCGAGAATSASGAPIVSFVKTVYRFVVLKIDALSVL